ncbi:MAG: hypothetical protein ACTSX9_05830 [Candidatus Njordarchaeales archaeon]
MFSNLIQVAITPQIKVCANCGIKIVGEDYSEEVDGEVLTFCCVHCAEHYKASRKHRSKTKS